MDIDKMKALALAAPKGWYGIYQIADGVTDNDAAALMKACSPAAVLELIAEVERYRWLREKHDAGDEQWFVYGAPDGKLDAAIDAARDPAIVSG